MFKLLAKLKTIGNALKYTANIIFLTISCLLIANLLIQLSDERFIKTVFVVVAVGLDLFRQYVVALAKFYWSKQLVKSIALWFVYIIHVSVVLIASVGFSLSAIDSKVKTTEVYNMERESIISNIKSNEDELKSLESVKNTLSNNDKRFKEVSLRIDTLQKIDRGLFEKLKGFSEVKVNIQKDVYDTLGKALHINGELIKLYMLLVISSLIELALLITSWDIQINQNGSLPETVTDETQTEIKKPETQRKKGKIQEKNGNKICPVCKKQFSYKHDDKIFCGATCRLRAYRNKAEEGALNNEAV